MRAKKFENLGHRKSQLQGLVAVASFFAICLFNATQGMAAGSCKEEAFDSESREPLVSIERFPVGGESDPSLPTLYERYDLAVAGFTRTLGRPFEVNRKVYLVNGGRRHKKDEPREVQAFDLDWDHPYAGLTGRYVSLLIDQPKPTPRRRGWFGFRRSAPQNEEREVIIATGIVTRFQAASSFNFFSTTRGLHPTERDFRGELDFLTQHGQKIEFRLEDVKRITLFPGKPRFSNQVQPTEPLSFFNVMTPDGVKPSFRFFWVNRDEMDQVLANVRMLLDNRQAIANDQMGEYPVKDAVGSPEETVHLPSGKAIENLGARDNWEMEIRTDPRIAKELGEPLLRRGNEDANGNFTWPKVAPEIVGLEVIVTRLLADEANRTYGVEVVSGKIQRGFIGRRENGTLARFILIQPYEAPEVEVSLDHVIELRAVLETPSSERR